MRAQLARRAEGAIASLMQILATGEPTMFALEGPCRHGLRSGLVLQGRDWARADEFAAVLVEKALQRLGATRPSWDQGQPWWTEEGATHAEHERCLRCGKPVPDTRRKYCDDLCMDAHQQVRIRQRHHEEINAAVRARRAARMAVAPLAERRCIECGKPFKPRWEKNARFCSSSCSNRTHPLRRRRRP